jgi:hypothetical protein
MPRKSQQDNLEEIRSLLAGLREVATRPVRAVPLLHILESTLDEAREAQECREIFRTATEEARQELSQILRRGHDAAVRARSYLKAYYGPYNAELTRFGINPIRRGVPKRTRSAAAGDKAQKA